MFLIDKYQEITNDYISKNQMIISTGISTTFRIFSDLDLQAMSSVSWERWTLFQQI